jgi:hypothetical protein
VSYLVATLKRDPRFAELFETADSLSTAVVEIAKERVLKPVRAVNTSGSSPIARGDPQLPTNWISAGTLTWWKSSGSSITGRITSSGPG